MGKEVIAQEDAGFVVPAGIDRIHVPAEGGFVEHVVVDERGGVDHFHRGRQRQVVAMQPAAGLAREEHQGGPQPLSAEANAVFDQVVDEGMLVGEFFGDEGLDLVKLPLDGRIEVVQRRGGLCPIVSGMFHERLPRGEVRR